MDANPEVSPNFALKDTKWKKPFCYQFPLFMMPDGFGVYSTFGYAQNIFDVSMIIPEREKLVIDHIHVSGGSQFPTAYYQTFWRLIKNVSTLQSDLYGPLPDIIIPQLAHQPVQFYSPNPFLMWIWRTFTNWGYLPIKGIKANFSPIELRSGDRLGFQLINASGGIAGLVFIFYGHYEEVEFI